MGGMIKAIKIDVEKQDVYYVTLNKDKENTYLSDIWDNLLAPCFTVACDIKVETAKSLKYDTLYVDDEGLIKEDFIGAFTFEDYPYQELYGHGLIVGLDDNGESVDCASTIEEIKAKVNFISNVEYLKSRAEEILKEGFKVMTF